MRFHSQPLLKVIVCFGIATTLVSCGWQRCPAVGKMLINQPTNISICSVIEAIRSPTIVKSVIRELNLTNSENRFLSQEDFLKGLTIEVIPDTDVLQISYKHSDSQLAIAIVDSLMKNYKQADFLKSKNQLAASRKLILEQINQKQQEIKAALPLLRELHEQMHKQKTKKEEEEKAFKLTKEFKNAQKEYQALIEELQEVNVAEHQKIGNVRVLTSAKLSCFNFQSIKFLISGKTKCKSSTS
ncbi:MAG: hypothetical protein IGS49_05675 [Chlorogloeopsis fritschii C42_A2020_084]|uniref:hypothetical protein n=1 Tax=Chlorogloeopsis fritschii TaxID=1124 RepID=UPI001A0C4271|nr:hypothetical protein [Chlorogloeopsis fritschii]MBF2004952.1 hypothetical protein [Chlorogloeopsis fritschii C42_A2020_084]